MQSRHLKASRKPNFFQTAPILAWRNGVARSDSRSPRINLCQLNLGLVKIALGFLRAKLSGGNRKACIFLVRGFAFAGQTCINFDAFRHRAEVMFAVRRFLRVGQNIDLSLDADGAQSSAVMSINLFDHIFDRNKPSPFCFARSPVSQACP
jgi:hypothetical protein